MEARHLLKKLKDDGWYLGDTEGASRQYVHPERPGVITVCVRFSETLGPDTLAAAGAPAMAPFAGEPDVVVETTGSGVSAYSVAVSGCVSTGVNEEEARQRLGEALALHMKRLGRLDGTTTSGDG